MHARRWKGVGLHRRRGANARVLAVLLTPACVSAAHLPHLALLLFCSGYYWLHGKKTGPPPQKKQGVQQSRGWVHYMRHQPEPHILLFKREKTQPDAAGQVLIMQQLQAAQNAQVAGGNNNAV